MLSYKLIVSSETTPVLKPWWECCTAMAQWGILVHSSSEKYNQEWHQVTQRGQGSSVCRVRKVWGGEGEGGLPKMPWTTLRWLQRPWTYGLQSWGPGIPRHSLHGETALLLYVQVYKHMWISKYQRCHRDEHFQDSHNSPPCLFVKYEILWSVVL